MYVVFFRDAEMHKDILFVTGTLQTATSFIHNFQPEMNELSKEYMSNYYNVRPLNTNWLYESGWNAKVQDLADRINISLNEKLSWDTIEYFINGGGSLDFEKVQVL